MSDDIKDQALHVHEDVCAMLGLTEAQVMQMTIRDLVAFGWVRGVEWKLSKDGPKRGLTLMMKAPLNYRLTLAMVSRSFVRLLSDYVGAHDWPLDHRPAMHQTFVQMEVPAGFFDGSLDDAAAFMKPLAHGLAHRLRDGHPRYIAQLVIDEGQEREVYNGLSIRACLCGALRWRNGVSESVQMIRFDIGWGR